MRRIHIFKAGKQTAMSGLQIDFSESDLAAAAAAYKPELHEAPLVVGHPKSDLPAYGWVKSLAADGVGLFAEPHQVNAEFEEQVKAGAYKKVSAAFYTPDHPHNPAPGAYYLRHVGFLGAQPPAVKGLKGIEFADDADCVEIELEFSESAPSIPAPPTQEITAVTPEEKAALEAQNAKLQADLAAAKASLRASAVAANTASHAAFAESLAADARIAPADKAVVTALLDFAEPPVIEGETPTVVEFGEGDAKQPIGAAIKAFLQALPKRVEFGEQASRQRAAEGEGKTADGVQYAEGTPPESIELDKRIRAHAKAHSLSYAEAAVAIASLPAKA